MPYLLQMFSYTNHQMRFCVLIFLLLLLAKRQFGRTSYFIHSLFLLFFSPGDFLTRRTSVCQKYLTFTKEAIFDLTCKYDIDDVFLLIIAIGTNRYTSICCSNESYTNRAFAKWQLYSNIRVPNINKYNGNNSPHDQ